MSAMGEAARFGMMDAAAEMHAYASESWFTEPGARIKRRRLERAGLPDFANWRFITLTLAGRQVSPLEGYRNGKARIRRFLARLRQAVGRKFLWCWKLEFHHDDDGYPHWHLLIEYKLPIPEAMLLELERWWGLGRVNVRRVKRKDIDYAFKYVAKGADGVPEWIARYRGPLRVFQASEGFYQRRKPRKAERKEPRFCLVKFDLRARLEQDLRKGLLIREDWRGQRMVRAVKLRMTFGAWLLKRANEAISRRVQLAPPGVVNLSQLEIWRIENEQGRFAGLAGITTGTAEDERWPSVNRDGDRGPNGGKDVGKGDVHPEHGQH